MKAETIDNLASAIGVPAAALASSIEEYNAIANGTPDEKFKTAGETLIPIEQGPFYAAKMVASGYGTIGGIATNDKFQALDSNDDVIDGLFAAGTDNGSMYYISYPMAVMGGTLQGFGATSGRLAAENAYAAYIK